MNNLSNRNEAKLHVHTFLGIHLPPFLPLITLVSFFLIFQPNMGNSSNHFAAGQFSGNKTMHLK